MERINKLEKMRTQAREDLKHVPKGRPPQNSLRLLYFNLRMNSLGKNPEYETKEEVLEASIQAIREKHPNFEPKYDKEFFKLEKEGS